VIRVSEVRSASLHHGRKQISAQESWKEAYRELVGTIVKMGYPEDFGKVIAKNLGSEKTMRRMTAYLHNAKPRSAEEIADEMLAIMSDRERWIKKKEAEQANAKYNELLYYGLGED
jgi:hypothetical protein